MKPTDWLTAVGALLAGLAGCSWLISAGWRAITGSEVRRTSAAVALTGAASVLVNELQEEVRSARMETASLRIQIAELQRLTDEKIQRLVAENHDLLLKLASKPQ